MASSSSDPGKSAETSEAAVPTDQLLLYRGLKKAKKERGCTAKERISKMPPCAAGKRSSIYRGVTRHRWTGRYEAHLWDKSTWNQNQNKKGKQGLAEITYLFLFSCFGIGSLDNGSFVVGPVYLGKFAIRNFLILLSSLNVYGEVYPNTVLLLIIIIEISRSTSFCKVMMLVADGFWIGAYDDEEAAARAYDLAALKYWGPGTLINFPVTDYTRDLEEMQNVSREEYLASLRRKSSGFSRGLSKYRGLSSYVCGASSSLVCYTATDFYDLCIKSDVDLTANLHVHLACGANKISRWESSYGRISGSDYFNSMRYGAGDDSAAESEYVSGFCIERKIDLTSHIKWWGSNKTRHSDSGTRLSSEEKKLGSAGDICSELKQLEQKVQPTEPYQMPQLGRPHNEKKQRSSSVSALRILSQSAAYKSLQEKASKKQENSIDNDENENKNTVNKLDHGKAIEKPSNHDGGSDRLDIAMGMSGTMPLQRNVYPLTPFLSAPLLTAYNTVDPMVDPVLWTSLVPVLPAGLSRTDEVTKTETSSTYTMFQPEE
ncbi:hypothetical protein V8G54_020285 [Vigna mungo]|uniref:AP2/ERF domain-containing protein n=1 Tax=Vigna mungo TaxID=3915 RepID=A0AAQ3RT70_VIGMU